MQKLLFLLFFGCLSANVNAQQPKVIKSMATHFQIKTQKDTIDFLVIDTVLNKKKPLFLFCQGSLPIPMFIQKTDKTLKMIAGGINNFDINEIKKSYHLVLISMPQTPLIVDENHINDDYCFVPDTSKKDSTDIRFLKADFLENYTKRAITVLNFLKKQNWVDNKKLVVAGHSQGTKVATKVAKNYKSVTHLGLFAANPFGRIDEMVRKVQKKAEKGTISNQDAETEIEQQYDIIRYAENDTLVRENPGLLAWKTFSEPMFDDWLLLKQPIYLAYGTADTSAELCDMMPIFFIQNHKNNLIHKRYWNLEHNFFEKKDNQTNYDKPHWQEVMHDFVVWSLK
jgi:ribosomal protein L14E/L6E/L27E